MKKISLLLAALLVLTTFVGCGKSKTPESVQTEETETVIVIEPVTKENLQAGLERIIAETQEAEAEDYLLAMESRSGFEVLSATELDEERAEARVRVFAPDLYSVVHALADKVYTSEEDMDRDVKEGVESAEILETELVLEFYPDDTGAWTPDLTEEFLDSYYGGLLRLRHEFIASAGGVQP